MYLRSQKTPDPESESDWDSHSEATNPTPRNKRSPPPHVEAENETSHSKDGPLINGLKPGQKLQIVSSSNLSGQPKTTNHNPNNQVQGKSENNSPGVTSFTGRREYISSDEERNSSKTVIQRKPDKAHSTPTSEEPPFDFSEEMRGQKERKDAKPHAPPGKTRKGNIYDAPHNMESWDDSDAEEKMLAKLRGGYKKSRPSPPSWKGRDHTTESGTPKKKRLSGQVKSQDIQATLKLDKGVDISTFDSQTILKNGGEPTKYIYHFDPGRREFLESSEGRGQAVLPNMADKAEHFIKRVWQEFFGLLQILFTFFLVFLVELVTFILRNIVQRTVLCILVAVGDHLVKPLLTALFNGYLQPVLIFVWNVLIGVRNAFQPVMDMLVGLAKPLVLVFQAFRLVDVHWKDSPRHQRPLQVV